MGDYFKQLDGLRFIAIFMVLISHYIQWQVGNPFVVHFPFNYGVTLFFVLSGFLITTILLKHKDEKRTGVLKSFYIRRVLRIFPVYYIVIFGLLITGYENTEEILPWLATYSLNIYQGVNNTLDVGNFNHFWSLCVEEQFYLAWPLFVLIVPRKWFVKVTVLLVVLSLLFKLYLFFYTDNWVRNEYSLFSNFSSLGIGGILSYLFVYSKERFNKVTSNSVFTVLVTVIFITYLTQVFFDLKMFKDTLMQFVWVLFFAIVIGKAVKGFTGIAGYLLSNPISVYLGRISYGIYIIHQFPPSFIYQYFPESILINNKYVGFIGFFLITVILASISWFAIEKPFIKLKSKFKY